MRKFNSAPLPFQGQKRGMAKHFAEVMRDLSPGTIVVDLFGGSGLLSHTAKWANPNLRVIYNDYDNYSRRLAAVSNTNELLDEIRPVLSEVPKGARLAEAMRNKVIGICAEFEMYGFVDYLTLSANLLFSGNYSDSLADFRTRTMYNRVTQSAYHCKGYLEGVEILTGDYRKWIQEFKGINAHNVVFVCDPPYLTTDVSSYAELYWRLTDYLDVLDNLRGSQFVYFTSEKSTLVELCGWLGSHEPRLDLFRDCETVTNKVVTSYRTSYNDLMLYRIFKWLD